MWASGARPLDGARSDPGQLEARLAPLEPGWIEEEAEFYGRHRWCLDAFPSVGQARARLRGQLALLGDTHDDWRRDEIVRSVFLLACAVADSTDDHLAGETWDFSQAVAVVPALDLPARLAARIDRAARRWRSARLAALASWRDAWGAATRAFLQASLAVESPDPRAIEAASTSLVRLLDAPLDARLRERRIKVPAAYRNQDLTHQDVVELASRYAAELEDRRAPLLVVGLRTAGSYFAPLAQATLAARGCADVEAVTLRPKRGVAPRERALLERGARRGARALVLDEPPDTGASLCLGLELLKIAGFAPERLAALVPVHPARPDWRRAYEALPLEGVRLLTLAPERWHKRRLLEDTAVDARLRQYFARRGYAECAVVKSQAAERINRELEGLSEHKFHTRLKRVYEVRLRRGDGPGETRFVLAKSVGWGWLGYHAFWSGAALREFVPAPLGLRDGILYSEWLRDAGPPELGRDRERLPQRIAGYVATRVEGLGLAEDPLAGSAHEGRKGVELLAAALGGAFGSKPASVLARGRLRHELTRSPCPRPTLIDGRMRLSEWLRAGAGVLKTDYEQHGFGKTELNVCDPAYDLADAILHFQLSAAEEARLLREYEARTGDAGAVGRLFFLKLLAGTAAANAALDNLRDPRCHGRRAEQNEGYLAACEFLTTQAARASGALCGAPERPRWRAPAVVLDVDGVLDKLFLSFPTTTAAGIEALRLLHAHGAALALNTARPLAEVREYCRAYGMLGGVAEYGAVAWDAPSDRTRVLVSPAAREELLRLAESLRSVPGVFLNDRYQHSLRVYAFERGRTVPAPDGLVQGLVAELGLRLLSVRHTYLDTTVVASQTDKGKGLVALLELAGLDRRDTIAIGDSEPDLAMFRVAGRCFAPSHASGRAIARQLGCEIARGSFQHGLLSAARAIVHPEGGRCPRCRPAPRPSGLWWELLVAADRGRLASLGRALLDPRSLEAFRR
ncbi:MAG: HAD hydrolase family protein [Vicinamibacteria bacterium]